MDGSPCFFANAKARRGSEGFEEAKRRLIELGMSSNQCTGFLDARELENAVREAADEGAERVIVGAGDGTISALAKYFVHSKTKLGIIPLGTGNQIARDLNIPENIPLACEIALGDLSSPIDVGVIRDDFFLNVVTIGLSSQIAQELTSQEKRTFGKFAYIRALLKAFAILKSFEIELSIEGDKRVFRAVQVVIGSGRTHAGPFPVAPLASIIDGKLNIYAVGGVSKWTLLKVAMLMPFGKQVELKEVEAFEATQCELSTRPPMRITVDGEPSGRTPIRVSILKGAINAIVSSDFIASN